MNEFQAIVFDLDDTLYPERDFVLSGFRAVAAWAETTFNIPMSESFSILKQLFEDGVRGEIFDRWLSQQDITFDNELVTQLVQVYRSHRPQIKPYPEVPALLSRLRVRYRLGLVSDGYLSVQRSKLKALGLASCFDAIVFSDAYGRDAWKPSTKPFEIILERLAIESESALYVADNPEKDFLGSKRLGMTTVWIRRLDGEYSHLSPPHQGYAPHRIFRSLLEFEIYLQRYTDL